jgi:two-component system OmpR family sensor kinase
MDGLQKRLRNSLQLRLTFWLSLAILMLAATVAGLSFYVAVEEAHELQDDTLRQIAALFDQSHLPVPQYSQSLKWDIDNAEDSHVIVQELSSSNHHKNLDILPLPTTLRDGLYTTNFHQETYQVFIKTLNNHQRLMVAQDTDIRDKIAINSVIHAFVPFLALMPIFLFMIPMLVRRILQPLSQAAQDVDQRDENDFSPIQSHSLVTEVQPFVLAINQLLKRTTQAIDAQRRFVADAAHELRSPLTALSLQAESLSSCESPTIAHQRLIMLRHGIERTKILLEQLLALAQAQSGIKKANRLYSAQYIYRQVLEDLIPLAEHKNIDIGVIHDVDVSLPIGALDFFKMIRNVVDNAIRYTPHGGRIDLSVNITDHQTSLIIEDNGIGLHPDEYNRVFDPFYRVLGSGETGSGLGLSIVNAIAQRYGATVILSPAAFKETGLRVEIVFRRHP